MSNLEKQFKAGVFFENGKYFITTEKGSRVQVDKRIAKIISIALKIQNRVGGEKSLYASEKMQKLVDLAKEINCHKMALFLRGEIDFSHLIKKDRMDAGHREVYYLGNKLPDNIFWTSNEMTDFLQRSEAPLSIHLLRVIDGNANYIPSHSFVWLGKDKNTGENICFQKVGPGLDRSFEIASLEEIIEPYVLQHDDVMHEKDLKNGSKTEYFFAAYPIEKYENRKF